MQRSEVRGGRQEGREGGRERGREGEREGGGGTEGGMWSTDGWNPLCQTIYKTLTLPPNAYL